MYASCLVGDLYGKFNETEALLCSNYRSGQITIIGKDYDEMIFHAGDFDFGRRRIKRAIYLELKRINDNNSSSVFITNINHEKIFFEEFSIDVRGMYYIYLEMALAIVLPELVWYIRIKLLPKLLVIILKKY
jgi:hypothetical protein